MNELNPKSELSLTAWRGIHGGASIAPEVVKGLGIRYVDWVLAGLIAMNGMYSALFGVGYVLVRYRKNAVLKRLKATPLQASQFLIAQILSRLFIVIVTSAFVFTLLHLTVKFRIDPNYGLLLLSMALGSLTMIALGLLMASRTRSEEFAGGLLNIVSMPMMIGSQVWFSLEGSPGWVQKISTALPLTPWVESMRKIMTEGAGFAEVASSFGWMVGWTVLFFALATALFRWE
jgi:ABC-2 type transport system permease protein